jgi:hypothetical protein
MAQKPKLGVNRGNAGKGRPKGVPNKTTAMVKDVITTVAAELGGSVRMLEWIKEAPENEKMFWGTIYPKLIPVQVESGANGFVVTLSQAVAKL